MSYLAPRQIHAHRGEVIELKARLDLLKLPETANEKARANEQRDREGHFADDEHAAEPLAGAAAGCAARAVLEALLTCGREAWRAGIRPNNSPDRMAIARAKPNTRASTETRPAGGGLPPARPP